MPKNIDARGKPTNLYVITYAIDHQWQADGEWYATFKAAVSQAKANQEDSGWAWRVYRMGGSGLILAASGGPTEIADVPGSNSTARASNGRREGQAR